MSSRRSSAMPPQRYRRMYAKARADSRQPAARDRDRVMYSGAFKRLAAVTQVVSPVDNAPLHSRLTHTLEVAQIGRRAAERLSRKIRDNPDRPSYIDPDVVEAAAFIHDLGHPPFGHAGEDELDKLVKDAGDPEGFNANAQSFRIVTSLSAHRSDYNGLDLCKATLNASLKYPWYADASQNKRDDQKSFGAYHDDGESFNFARKGIKGWRQTIEAEILDFADDVAYSVHDFEDFYRFGLFPLERLLYEKDEMGDFIKAWKADKREPPNAGKLIGLFRNLLSQMHAPGVYTGTFGQRAIIRLQTSSLIGEFVEELGIQKGQDGSWHLVIPPLHKVKIDFLKRIIWHYVITNPRLTTQQRGHRAIVDMLYGTYLAAIKSGDRNLIPGRFQLDFDKVEKLGSEKANARLASDIICSLTDSQAVTLFRRMSGERLGAISDVVMW